MQRTLVLVLAVAIAAGTSSCAMVGRPPAELPEGLGRPIGDFGAWLAMQLDEPLGTQVTYAGYRWRADDRLVILLFELRPPNGSGPPRLGYLASRCTPVNRLDPGMMGGGVIADGDVEDDPEIRFLADRLVQPPCP